MKFQLKPWISNILKLLLHLKFGIWVIDRKVVHVVQNHYLFFIWQLKKSLFDVKRQQRIYSILFYWNSSTLKLYNKIGCARMLMWRDPLVIIVTTPRNSYSSALKVESIFRDFLLYFYIVTDHLGMKRCISRLSSSSLTGAGFPWTFYFMHDNLGWHQRY